DFREMLIQHPEINLVVEAALRPALRAELRRELPPHVTLLERSAAGFFLHLLAQGRVEAAWQIDRENTLSLLTATIDQLRDDLLLLDPEGVVVSCNQTMCDRTGHGKREIIGRRLEEVFPGMRAVASPDAPAPDPLAHTLEFSQPAEAIYSEVDPEGRLKYWRLYTQPIIQSGHIAHVVAIRRDITRRTNMEQRLQQAEKLASIGQLSTYIAHEIRNPLFAISGFANQLLRSPDLGDPAKEKLQIILEESRRLDGILKSILNFARPMQARSAVVDVNEVARATMRVMGIGSGQQGVRIAMDLDESIAKAKGDPELVTQCLINLVKNAMEAMEEHGGDLTVSTAMTPRHVLLTVRDTGCGIPADIRDKVFSPFFSTKGKGSGLGLAMIRKILDEIGGDVTLTSVEGEGTSVTLRLPPALAVAKPDGIV
ncbi:MAG: ATP-binding protein, partial [Desulfovibrionaceae bacterium]